MYDAAVLTPRAQAMSTTEDDPGAKVYVHRDVFEQLREIQRGQGKSPRFDLRDLTSAALRYVLSQPESSRLILEMAYRDFARRIGRQ
ncbi:MAG TPA: hypothetical protein PKV98_01470 [Burkholderiaceae bacterium]|nr:hypothetical protein [Burkholderiaceae bacterium]